MRSGTISACSTPSKVDVAPRARLEIWSATPMPKAGQTLAAVLLPCGSLDPVNNYMDYSDDACMNQFTPDQARRMRCTLEFYRSELPEIGPGVPLNLALDTAPTPTVGSSGLSDRCKLKRLNPVA